MRCDFFWHRWNRRAPDHKGAVVEVVLEDVEETDSLDVILAEFREEYPTEGSHHTTGLFQIPDRPGGVFRRWDGASFAQRTHTAQFFTWEELEIIELQGLEFP